MKIRNEQIQVDTNGLKNQGAFGIELNPSLMTMLYRNIYSNPILAVVRELGCNARDAQVVHGKKGQAIDVHLPNSMEPWFEIRDYGCGMTKVVIEQLYSFFGRSDKRDDNGLIGGMGFGSKAPLAYADTFTVSSIVDGFKYVYLIFKGEDGHPHWGEVASEETSEPNGVCINVPVRDDKDDFRAFQEAFICTFKYFDVPVNVTGVEIDLKPVTYSVYVQNMYGMRKEDQGNETRIVMGNTMYPIQWDALRLPKEVLKKYDNILVNISWSGEVRYAFSYDYFFEIGELDITPSREDIQYSERTVGLIKERLEKVYNTIIENTQSVIDLQKCLWGAVGVCKEIPRAIVSKCTFRGNPIDLNLYLPKVVPFDDFIVQKPTKYNPTATSSISSLCFISLNFDDYENVKRGTKLRLNKASYLKESQKCYFILSDMGNKYSLNQIFNNIQIDKNTTIYVIVVNNPSLKENFDSTFNQINTYLKDNLFGENNVNFTFTRFSTIVQQGNIQKVKKQRDVAPKKDYLFATGWKSKFENLKTVDECVDKAMSSNYNILRFTHTQHISPSETQGKVYVTRTRGCNFYALENLDIDKKVFQYILYRLGVFELIGLYKSEETKAVKSNWINLDNLLVERKDQIEAILQEVNKGFSSEDFALYEKFLRRDTIIGEIDRTFSRLQSYEIESATIQQVYDWVSGVKARKNKMVTGGVDKLNFNSYVCDLIASINDFAAKYSLNDEIPTDGVPVLTVENSTNSVEQEEYTYIKILDDPLNNTSDVVRKYFVEGKYKFNQILHEILTVYQSDTDTKKQAALKVLELIQ